MFESKYDAILLVLSIVILVMIGGVTISPYIAIGAGLVGIVIAGYAMFVIPPE